MTASRWWNHLAACAACGASVELPAMDGRGRCERCGLEWSQEGHVTVWRGAVTAGDERRLPADMIAGRRAVGRARARYLAKRAVWNAIKAVALPVRHLQKRRAAAFEQRSLVDRRLAEHWRGHYLKGLDIPPDALMFEYSYRKAEKLGFAGLLGYRIAIQDIRSHAWWGEQSHAWYQLVSLGQHRLPFRDGVVDLAFTDGLIFDMDRGSLDAFFVECLRILRPGGHLLVWAGNSLSRSRAKSETQWHGRIHSLESVTTSVQSAGFAQVDVSFEGYAPPFGATAINTIRTVLAPWPFKTYDYDSWLAHWQKPEKRAYWLLRLVRPAMNASVG